VTGELPEDSADPRPVAPPEPEPWECCQSGCDPCVYDRYWEALERYERALTAWNSRHVEPYQSFPTETEC
jgi:hypothetical protein